MVSNTESSIRSEKLFSYSKFYLWVELLTTINYLTVAVAACCANSFKNLVTLVYHDLLHVPFVSLKASSQIPLSTFPGFSSPLSVFAVASPGLCVNILWAPAPPCSQIALAHLPVGWELFVGGYCYKTLVI